MADEPAAKKKQNTGSRLYADSLDDQVIFRCYYCKREIPLSSFHVAFQKMYQDKLRQKTFHINCMFDYFEGFASVNEERRNERETDGKNATTEKSRSASS